MSAVIRVGVLLLLVISCHSKEKETVVASPVMGGATYFSPLEVVSALNVLVAINDWPQETIEHQKNFKITPESAKTLILALRPIWDEKVEETTAQIPTWDKAKISDIVPGCLKRCDCDFYQEVLDRHPEVVMKIGLELKDFAGLQIQKSKADLFACLKSTPSIQNLLNHLEQERKNYEAGSAY